MELDTQNNITEENRPEPTENQDNLLFSGFTRYDCSEIVTLYEINRSGIIVPHNHQETTPKRKTIPLKPIHIVWMMVILVVVILLAFYKDNSVYTIFFMTMPWISFAFFLQYVLLKKPTDAQIKQTSSLRLQGETASFYNNYLSAASAQPGYSCQLSIYYSELRQIIETPNQFFFILPNGTFIVVSKEGLLDFTPQQASTFLQNTSTTYRFYVPKSQKQKP